MRTRQPSLRLYSRLYRTSCASITHIQVRRRQRQCDKWVSGMDNMIEPLCSTRALHHHLPFQDHTPTPRNPHLRLHSAPPLTNTVACGDGLRVELHAKVWTAYVREPHDQPAIGCKRSHRRCHVTCINAGRKLVLVRKSVLGRSRCWKLVPGGSRC